MAGDAYPFVNLPLPYSYDALEPFIDAKTMELHHNRHLQTYINNLNGVLKDHPQLQKLSLEQLIRSASRMPKELQTAVRNNAGGVFNHRFFFDGMGKASEGQPAGRLSQAIGRRFGSYDGFREAFRKAALAVFGSGYAWLVTERGRLQIMATPNQNSPVERCLCPVLAIDVWEHAYYLKHYNGRADYIDDWFRVINWEQAEKNYRACTEDRTRLFLPWSHPS